MKRAKFLIIQAFIIFMAMNASGQAFVKGTNVIGLGLGIGGHFNQYSYNSRSPTFSFQYEKGLWNAGPGVISIGGYAGFTSYNYAYSGNNFRSNYTIIGARGAYHFNRWPSGNDALKKLDVYGGLMIYYNITSSNFGGDSIDSYMDAGLYAGGRYFFSNNFGAFAEIGSGVSYLTLGVAFKF